MLVDVGEGMRGKLLAIGLSEAAEVTEADAVGDERAVDVVTHGA